MTVLILFLSTCNGRAHGIDAWVAESAGKLPTLNFEYSDGSPVSYASVKIWSPASDSLEYQNGRTDKNGRFGFIPDMVGEWRITVNDGAGHRTELAYDVQESRNPIGGQTLQRPDSPLNRTLLAVLGCSLILNMGYVIGLLQGKYRKWAGAG